MKRNESYAIAFGIGFVAGLRSMTAPAAVSRAAHAGRLKLDGTPLEFMASESAATLFSLAAAGEYVGDKLPGTPARTAPLPLMGRILTGALSGACLCAAAKESLEAGALFGALGGVAGSFGGYEVRKNLVHDFKVKDIAVAIPEDLLAIGLATWLTSLE